MTWYHKFFKFKTIYGHGDAGPYRTYFELFERLRLHIFWRGDSDPYPHDHPMDFWTFPLTSYVEEVTVKQTMPFEDPKLVTYPQVVERFRWHFRPGTYMHRLTGRYSGMVERRYSTDIIPMRPWIANEAAGLLIPIINDKPVITIVWLGKKYRDWGYLVDGEWRKFDDT